MCPSALDYKLPSVGEAEGHPIRAPHIVHATMGRSSKWDGAFNVDLQSAKGSTILSMVEKGFQRRWSSEKVASKKRLSSAVRGACSPILLMVWGLPPVPPRPLAIIGSRGGGVRQPSPASLSASRLVHGCLGCSHFSNFVRLGEFSDYGCLSIPLLPL